MRRSLLLIALVVVAVLAVPSVAMASGWNAVSLPMTSPHTGYATTTNYCKVCHAVHGAEDAVNVDGERLLRSSVLGACDYCHVGGPVSATQVYDSSPTVYAADTDNEHTLSLMETVPDSWDPPGTFDPAVDYVIDLGCTSCHAVHGAACITSGTTKPNILKADPIGDLDVATTVTQFCADCHDDNLVTAFDQSWGTAPTDQVSHIMSSVVHTYAASASSADCRSCHSGGNATAANNWPHSTTGVLFLKDAYDGNNGIGHELDSVCLDCHPTVGVAY